jgi:hypothetical protein
MVAQVTWDLFIRQYTPYPLPPTVAVAWSSTQSLFTQSASILFMLPATLTISYRNIFTFFLKLKETFKFGLAVAILRALSLPPSAHKLLLWRAVCARSKLGGPWHGKISAAQVSYDLDSQIFGTFCIISKKGIIVGGKYLSKNKENTSPGIWFFQNFFA